MNISLILCIVTDNFAPLVYAYGLGGAGGGGSFSNRGGRGGSSGFSDSRGNRGSYGHFEEGGGGGGREWSRGGRGGYGGRSRPDPGRDRRPHSDEFKEPSAGKNVTGPYCKMENMCIDVMLFCMPTKYFGIQ